jgi:putative ABC transport system permease protein
MIVLREDLNQKIRNVEASSLRGDAWLRPGSAPGRIRSALVVGEMALALILLTGAALLIHSFVLLRSVNPGFDSHNILTLRMSLTSSRFDSTKQVNQFVQDSAQRCAICAKSSPSARPRGCHGGNASLRSGTRPAHWAISWLRPLADISPGYFDTLTIPLMRGRLFSDRETARPAAL